MGKDTTNSTIKQIIVEFDHELKTEDIPKFRGAVISSMEHAPLQYHNHGDTGLIYSYPLIQYKCIENNAAVVCLGDAIKSIGCFLADYNPDLAIGKKTGKFHIKNISIVDADIRHSDYGTDYLLTEWIPFNQKNYARFSTIDSLSTRCAMLEKILIGNILSFSKGLGIFIDFNIDCSIQEIVQSKIMCFKKVKMTTYSLRFRCNVDLPDYIGLGKGVSHGFGVLTKYK